MGLIVTVRYESQDGRQMEMRSREFRSWVTARKYFNRMRWQGWNNVSQPHGNHGPRSWPSNVWCREVNS